MKETLRPALLGSLAFALVLVANDIVAASPPGASGPDEQAVRDAEARWVEALEHRDAPALQALLDEDFVDITWKGEVRDRRAAIAALTAPGRPAMKQTLQDLRVRFATPDVAIVTGVNLVSSKAPNFTAHIRFTDVFVKRTGAWKALSAQETLEQDLSHP